MLRSGGRYACIRYYLRDQPEREGPQLEPPLVLTVPDMAALRQGDMADPKGFLESMQVELANLPSAMSTVTFLVDLTLEQLIGLNRLIRLQDRDGRNYDSRKNPYCGYVVIDKDTMTGLYDPWQGGGSVFEIQLEKDVRLPVKFIRSALPDGGDGYSVEEVYGMCGSAWKQGGVKMIHAPVKLAA